MGMAKLYEFNIIRKIWALFCSFITNENKNRFNSDMSNVLKYLIWV